MSSDLPDWYVLKDPGNVSATIDQLLKYAEIRLERLLDNNPWLINRTFLITDEEWEEIVAEELGGHLFLRLAVAKDPRLTSWLVEVEGDLFEFRLITTPEFEEKIAVIRHLLGDEYVLTIDQLDNKFGLDIYKQFGLADVSHKSYARKRFGSKSRYAERRIAIYFTKIPSIISQRKAFLYKGWAIVSIETVRLAIKRVFEQKLKEQIEKSRNLFKKDPSLEEIVKPLREEIVHLAPTRRLSADLSSLGIDKGEKLFQRTDLFPPCILELISVLQSKGHLSHVENWQLGTFLKRAGMSIEEQYEFWYHSSVDNVGLSFDEFVSRIGYQIRHIYGKEGGGIDYQPPSCKTCINGYFCLFAHKKLEDITQHIRERFKDKKPDDVENAINVISRHIINQQPRAACAAYFRLHTGLFLSTKYTNHMMQYLIEAFKAVSKRKHTKKKVQDSNSSKNQKDESNE